MAPAVSGVLSLVLLPLATGGGLRSARHDVLGTGASAAARCLAHLGSAAPNGTQPDSELLEAMKKVYTLQYVGLDPDGNVRDPLASPTRCLTSLGESHADVRNGGVAVGFSKCPHALQKDSSGAPTGK